MKPWFWVFAGPNGSGKTTLARSGELRRWESRVPLQVQSPDDIARLLPQAVSAAGEAAYVRAAQAASDVLVDSAIADGRDIAVETVGSSDKFHDRVLRAQAAGFGFGLVFVTVVAPELNLARVEDRVAEGGHDVPPDRILARRIRSHAGFAWFAARAELGLLVDNSGMQAHLVAEKRSHDPAWRVLDPVRLPDLTVALALSGQAPH